MWSGCMSIGDVLEIRGPSSLHIPCRGYHQLLVLVQQTSHRFNNGPKGRNRRDGRFVLPGSGR
jgi:hypothetical protein